MIISLAVQYLNRNISSFIEASTCIHCYHSMGYYCTVQYGSTPFERPPYKDLRKGGISKEVVSEEGKVKMGHATLIL